MALTFRRSSSMRLRTNSFCGGGESINEKAAPRRTSTRSSWTPSSGRGRKSSHSRSRRGRRNGWSNLPGNSSDRIFVFVSPTIEPTLLCRRRRRPAALSEDRDSWFVKLKRIGGNGKDIVALLQKDADWVNVSLFQNEEMLGLLLSRPNVQNAIKNELCSGE